MKAELRQDTVEVDTIETHTEGQVTRIVTDGIDEDSLGAGSITERRERFDTEYGWLPDFLLGEPRGHPNLVGCVPLTPTTTNGDIGLIFFDSAGYLDNCGDAVIGTTTALIETGRLEPTENLVVETPGGTVSVRVSVSADDGVEQVAIQGMRGFVYDRVDLELETSNDDRLAGDMNTIPVDIAYGAGNWFAYVDADDVAVSLDPAEGDRDRIVDVGVTIRSLLNESLQITNPLTNETGTIDITMFFDESGSVDKNAIVYGAGSIGRSPCGTGTAGKLAVLYDRGALDIGESYEHASMINSRFTGVITAVETTRGVTVTTGEIGGSAHIISTGQFVQSASDTLGSFRI